MQEITAIMKARSLLRDLEVDQYPVDVQSVASALGFEIEVRFDLASNQAGQVLTLPGRKIIIVNGNDQVHRQRFTILHEIAHDVLGLPSNHGAQVSSAQLTSYSSRPREEVLCDVFAAECLVPWSLLKPLLPDYPYSLASIRALSDHFEASLTCVASRLAQASSDPVLFVLAEDGVVRYVTASQQAREYKFWVNVGIHLPKQSAANSARQSGSQQAQCDCDGIDWSASDAALGFSCFEEAVVLGEWGQTLSLLTLEMADTAEQDRRSGYVSDESDLLLKELTGELPWPRR